MPTQQNVNETDFKFMPSKFKYIMGLNMLTTDQPHMAKGILSNELA